MKTKHQVLAVCVVLMFTVALVFLQIPRVSANGFPRNVQTVAEIDIIGQLGSLPETTLFVPTETGLYRLSGYFVVTNRGSNGHMYINALWTDPTGIQRSQLGFLCTDEVGCLQSSTVVVYAIAGQPILFKASASGVQKPP